MFKRVVHVVLASTAAAVVSLGLLRIDTAAQDRLKSMPGYVQYQKVAPHLPSSLKSGAVSAVWAADGRSFEYSFDGKRFRYDLGSRQAATLGGAADGEGRGRVGPHDRPAAQDCMEGVRDDRQIGQFGHGRAIVAARSPVLDSAGLSGRNCRRHAHPDLRRRSGPRANHPTDHLIADRRPELRALGPFPFRRSSCNRRVN